MAILKVSKSYLQWANSNNVPLVYITDAENRQKRHWLKKSQ
jgi:hypothetical protein